MKSIFQNRKVFLVALLAMLTSACTMSSCRLGTTLLFGYDPSTWCDAFGSLIYVAEGQSQTGASVIPLTGSPYGLMAPQSPSVYIRQYYSRQNAVNGGVYFGSTNGITVIQGRTQAFKNAFQVTPGLQRFEIDQTGNWLLETSSQSSALQVFDLNKKSLAYTIDFGAGANPFGIAIQSDDSRAFITDPKKNLIYSVDFIGKTFRTISDPGQQPRDPALTPDGQNLYVPNYGSSNLFVLDTFSETPILTLPTAAFPSMVAFNEYGTRGYVLNSPATGAGALWTFDPSSFMSIGSTPLGTRPASMSFTAGGTFMYSAMSGDGVVDMINLNLPVAKVVASFPVGNQPLSTVVVSAASAF